MSWAIVVGTCLHSWTALFLRPTKAEGQLLSLIRLQAKHLGVSSPIAGLAVNMIRSEMGERPKLKLKAAEGRYMLPNLIAMLQHNFP